MYPDCRCNDELGSLTYVGDDRTEPYDEVFDEPDGRLAGLAFTDDPGVELGAFEYVEDGEVGWVTDVLNVTKAVFDKVAGGGKGKSNQAAARERQRADDLQKELERERREGEREREKQRVAEARQKDLERKREMAELEKSLDDMRSQQAAVRSRLNREQAARNKKLIAVGGGLLLAGTVTAVGVTLVRRIRK
ncbi:MAG: hypothetical protein KC583_03005 [Myxococcales bacterium]|nr:hypothetical protein [Myxococcales bacterium]